MPGNSGLGVLLRTGKSFISRLKPSLAWALQADLTRGPGVDSGRGTQDTAGCSLARGPLFRGLRERGPRDRLKEGAGEGRPHLVLPASSGLPAPG